MRDSGALRLQGTSCRRSRIIPTPICKPWAVNERKWSPLFSDLKGFTSDSERLDPAEMVTLLNEYFREMVEVVFEHSGTLDKFIGDALMATWGGIQPGNLEEDARKAVRTALKMKERLAAINVRRKDLGVPPGSSGIGISLGPAVFGNIGSQQGWT